MCPAMAAVQAESGPAHYCAPIPILHGLSTQHHLRIDRIATLGGSRASSSPENSPFCIDVPELLVAPIKRGELGAFEQIYRLFEKPA